MVKYKFRILLICACPKNQEKRLQPKQKETIKKEMDQKRKVEWRPVTHIQMEYKNGSPIQQELSTCACTIKMTNKL